MQQVLILCGISGNGKSTFAKQFCLENPNWLRINRDDLRRSLLPFNLTVFWKQSEEEQYKIEVLVSTLQNALLVDALKRGWNVIVDNTHLKKSYLNDLLKNLRNFEVEVKFKLFDSLPIEECIERDRLRSEPVGEDVIKNQYERLKILKKVFDFQQVLTFKPAEIKQIVQDESLPRCVLVDIDGTVATMQGRMAYHWDRVSEDAPKYNIIRMVKALKQANYQIVFISGRDGVCFPQTQAWLCQHFVWQTTDFQLLMRNPKDQRKDNLIKYELFKNYIEGNYYVDFVIDDRNQVVEMWRKKLGLTCLQVDYGDF